MQKYIRIATATVALIGLAAIILLSSQRVVQAQTPNLSVAGAVYAGTSAANTTQGPVPPCYQSTGIACDGKLHMVAGSKTQSLFALCGSNQQCDLTLSDTYVTVMLSSPAAFSNANYACSATIWTSTNGYVGYCRPLSMTSLAIYMYNPTNSAVSASTLINISYSASGF